MASLEGAGVNITVKEYFEWLKALQEKVSDEKREILPFVFHECKIGERWCEFDDDDDDDDDSSSDKNYFKIIF